MKKIRFGAILIKNLIFYGSIPMGTFLQSKGLPSGVRLWNIENLEAVINMHQGYFEAGQQLRKKQKPVIKEEKFLFIQQNE